MGRAAREKGIIAAAHKPTRCPLPHIDDLSRSLTALDENSTLIAAIEMSPASWLVAGIVPGVARHPLKKPEADETAPLKLLHRWREEAGKAGHAITRIAVAFEAGRDGFWLARRLRAHEPARHRAVEAGLSRRAARGTRPLQHGRDPQPGRRGRQAAEPRARKPGRRAHAPWQPDQGHPGAPGHSSGIRGFKPTLRKAAERVDGLRTPEGRRTRAARAGMRRGWRALGVGRRRICGGWRPARRIRALTSACLPLYETARVTSRTHRHPQMVMGRIRACGRRQSNGRRVIGARGLGSARAQIRAVPAQGRGNDPANVFH